jgi:hypothetical protein
MGKPAAADGGEANGTGRPAVSVHAELGASTLLVALVGAAIGSSLLAGMQDAATGGPYALFLCTLVFPACAILWGMSVSFRAAMRVEEIRRHEEAAESGLRGATAQTDRAPYRGGPGELGPARPRRRLRAAVLVLVGGGLFVSSAWLWRMAIDRGPEAVQAPAVGATVAILGAVGALAVVCGWPKLLTGEGSPIEARVGRPSPSRVIRAGAIFGLGVMWTLLATQCEAAALDPTRDVLWSARDTQRAFLGIPCLFFGALAFRAAYVVLRWRRPRGSAGP